MQIGQRIRINREIEGLYARWAKTVADADCEGRYESLFLGVYEVLDVEGDNILLAEVFSSNAASNKHCYLVSRCDLEGFEIGDALTLLYEPTKRLRRD